MGKWIDLEGSEDGRHRCNLPAIWFHAGMLAPKVNSVWQCDCLTQWRITAEAPRPIDVPGGQTHTPRVLRWERLEGTDVMPSRRAVLDELASKLAPRDDPDAVAVWRGQTSAVLEALESRHMARWSGHVRDQAR